MTHSAPQSTPAFPDPATPSAQTDPLRRLLDDHLPHYLRLPSDFLVWTQAGGPQQPAANEAGQKNG